MTTRQMNRRSFLEWTGTGALAVCSVPVRASEGVRAQGSGAGDHVAGLLTPDTRPLTPETSRSNIVFILADDIGYGDFGCYGATKVKTPNVDRLAGQGLRFTDAHSPSAVCTPTRYAFMTGEYAWRKKGTGILPGIAALIVEPGRVTVPSLLKQAGYVTGIPRIGSQTGGKAALWKDDEIADTLAAKADAFIERNRSKPFFLFLSTHDIHVPRVPNPRFKGTSQAGVRGDTIHSFDWTVGQVLATLDRLKLADNTLVIVTSDNGGVLDANGPDTEHGGTPETNNGHPHNGLLRAGKGSAYEGGTRVPFIIRWPGRIKPGVSDALICHVDMLAAMAALTGQKLVDAAGPDSFNVLPALLGEKLDKPCRDHLVEHGSALAIRKGPWKLIPANPPLAAGKKNKKRAGGSDQLYNLAEDIGETTNLASEKPELVAEMSTLMEKLIADGRSAPGAKQKNDVDVRRYLGAATSQKKATSKQERR